MRIRVLGNRLGPPRGGNPLAQGLAFKIERQLIKQVIAIAVSRQVHAIAKQLGQPVVAQVVGHEQRPARNRLEHAHIHVIANAAIKRDACRRIRACHVIEVALADERIVVPALNQPEQIATRPRKHVAHERNVVLLGHVIVLAMDTRITRQRQPRSRSDPDATEQINPVALGGKHQVKPRRLLTAAVEIKVRVDGPEGTRPAIRRQVIAQAVIDVQVKVEAHCEEFARAHEAGSAEPRRSRSSARWQ